VSDALKRTIKYQYSIFPKPTYNHLERKLKLRQTLKEKAVMLKSYEAIYEKGEVKWLHERPEAQSARLIVTVLEETPALPTPRRFPPASIAGKGKTLGDIVSPIVDEEDWECLK
jgi:hypothetical protein